MKYKVKVWDESNTLTEAFIDTKTLNIDEEDWFLLTECERESMLIDELYSWPTLLYNIVAISYEQVI